jgi:hypothetical protein
LVSINRKIKKKRNMKLEREPWGKEGRREGKTK